MKFRKKPVVIEAVKAEDLLYDAEYDWDALPDWVVERYEEGGFVFEVGQISILTLEGTMVAGPEDWIIRGVQGEVYPCKPEIFDQTYEFVEES